MERKIKISIGEYYHIYNRGVEKRKIFLEKGDWERFTRLLYIANSDKPFIFRLIQGLPLNKIDIGRKKAAIIAYVLMPNHFHLLIRENIEGGVSEFMGKLLTGYAMYFNKKYKRVGPLFQGIFKAEHVDRDEYLKYLFAYIHLNPVKLIEPNWEKRGIFNKKKAKRYLERYYFSSYLDYLGEERSEGLILAKGEGPDYFSNTYEFNDFICDWMDYKNT